MVWWELSHFPFFFYLLVIIMHDRNGTELKVGDRVALEGIIRELQPGDDYCNVVIQSTSYVMPNTDRFDRHTFNTHELYLVNRLVLPEAQSKDAPKE